MGYASLFNKSEHFKESPGTIRVKWSPGKGGFVFYQFGFERFKLVIVEINPQGRILFANLGVFMFSSTKKMGPLIVEWGQLIGMDYLK